jgi:hypothetical protein
MRNDIIPYVPRNSGDLITAGDWNTVQVDVKKDIASQIQTAVGQVNNVAHAGDADTLGGKTPDQLTQEIIKRVLSEIPGRTGYQMLFKRIRVCEEKVIKHGLHAFPLVDAYQLDYFPCVCSKGETDATARWVNLYLYHTSEKRIRIPNNPNPIDIEPPDTPPYKILFSDMLALYKVKFSDTSCLDDMETDFWTAFFAAPNDQYDPDQYCHSPWFEKCCGERRSVKELRDRGDWDDLWLKMVPRKTINYTKPATDPCAPAGTTPPAPTDAPSKIQVVHFDFDTLGVKLLTPPDYPDKSIQATSAPPGYEKEIKLMLLLKV